ncbi:methyltransferase family protein [Actinocorallia herbida]|uniref:Methyltransferase family protein n=1 Tax=Actinocorallia herbida TaxID=58109 RepID=A0A3N1D2H2_9ACTN|nr:class I SAM-dependent methyltransferase [Actinocorallia herbida]ROO87721.1 methyltransferase family protein [Actinocorallia herbida]
MSGRAALPAWSGDDPFTAAVASGTEPLWLREQSGRTHPLDVARWFGPAESADLGLLERSRDEGGPALDVGCGPGRLVAALLALGVPALGVDIASAAVALARARGGAAVRRSVFDPLPAEGRWASVLLADGNIGIGGDPSRLIRRVADLLAPGGLLLAEVEADDVDECLTVQVEDGTGRCGPTFAWARLGPDAAARHAAACGLTEVERWSIHGRCFAAFRS